MATPQCTIPSFILSTAKPNAFHGHHRHDPGHGSAVTKHARARTAWSTRHDARCSMWERTAEVRWTKSMLQTQALVTAISAILGPLLDNYHTQFHVLRYAHPLALGAHVSTSALTPPLFATAGLILSTGALLLPQLTTTTTATPKDSGMPGALASTASFASLYYLSAALPQLLGATGAGMTTTTLTGLAGLHWWRMDSGKIGLWLSLATAVCGPAVECVMIAYGWHEYAAPQLLGIPSLIVPVYFAGGSAVANLALAIHALLASPSHHAARKP